MDEPQRQLTPRAIITGFVLGALLVPCNVYSGLKIGWSFNMSIVAALLSYGFWNGLHAVGKAPRWGLFENNINQTAASSSASIISAGLVAPIPALTLLTGRELVYPILVVWVFVVSLLGVVVAVGVRRHLLLREKLPFPNGVATAETIREMYGHGREAVYRIKLLLSGGLISGGLKWVNDFWYQIPSLALPGRLAAPANLAANGISSISMRNLGFTLEPSLLLVGFGAIVGLRVGISLLLGALLGWLLLPKELLARGWALPGSADAGAFWFSELLERLLWPGVALMVTASLTSFLLSIIRLLRQRETKPKADDEAGPDTPGHIHYVPRSWFRGGLAVAFIASVIAQRAIFGIPIWLGIVAVLFTFILAIVAGRQKSPDRAIVAHLDTTGAMVKELKSNGRLAVVPVGTWSPRFAEGARVSVFTDETIFRGTILPLKASGHTYNDEVNTQPVAWENLEIRVDERAGTADELRELGFNVGDFVGVDSGAEILPSGFVNARHLDDKAGVAALLTAVKHILDKDLELPVDIHLLFTISEEVGSGASAVLHGDVSEMVSIDNGTSAPGQASSEFGVTVAMADSTGPFDYHLTHHIINLCRNNDIPFVRDIFRYYRCDSASAVEAGNDIRTALVTFGVDGSHGYERTHFASLESVAQLIVCYARSEPLYKLQKKKLNTLEGFPETRLVEVEAEVQEESAQIAQTPPAA